MTCSQTQTDLTHTEEDEQLCRTTAEASIYVFRFLCFFFILISLFWFLGFPFSVFCVLFSDFYFSAFHLCVLWLLFFLSSIFPISVFHFSVFLFLWLRMETSFFLDIFLNIFWFPPELLILLVFSWVSRGAEESKVKAASITITRIFVFFFLIYLDFSQKIFWFPPERLWIFSRKKSWG